MVLNITSQTPTDDDTMEVHNRGRRHGLGNIFEGIEHEILIRLGWTHEALHEVEKCRSTSESSTTESECSTTESECPDYCSDVERNDDDVDCEDNFCRPRCYPSRKRRNGLADLFEVLSVNQKQKFVELIQNVPYSVGVTGCA